jgi:uncharacterized protein with NRDE domain
MCVAAIAWQAHPRWHLVAIANRDEFHERPTAPLMQWNDGSGIIAGRDERLGGTWLGVSEGGRFALVTNFRKDGYPKPGLASRGALVTDWLENKPDADFAAMNPFHLLRIAPVRAEHVTNWPEPAIQPLAPGFHGVSNGAFDKPWPKTGRLVAALGEWCTAGDDDAEALLAVLTDETPLPAESDSEGPEQRMSPIFIRDSIYGTRSSTVVMVDGGGKGRIIERRFDPAGNPTGETALALDWSLAGQGVP